jgi:predicted HicB family RNase H-like nuclease
MIDIFDGFTVNLLYDENDKDWVAHFVELPLVSAFGNTPNEAIHELKVAWDGAKQSYISQGEPVPVSPSKRSYSGQFNVRIDKRLHKALAIEACQAHVSLNALVAQKLAKQEGYSS